MTPTAIPSRVRGVLPALAAFLLAAMPSGVRAAGTAYGSINNFDVVNDTGVECHGFEIEIEDLHSPDITYTFDWNHYGTPAIREDDSDPLHPRVLVRYAAVRLPDGRWSTLTAIPSGPIAPTDGHQFTDPTVNFGGEHFGVGFRGIPGPIRYFWLVDDGAGNLVRGPSVQVSTPSFTYQPPAGGVPAQVQAVIQPAPAPPVLEFGPATWVKEIRTTSHNDREVRLRDLVSDDPDDPDDRNWRNGEPDEVEVEWQLLQQEFKKADGGENGELRGAPEALPDGDEVVTRRYEFYRYVGPLDAETGEAKASKVGPDGIHGEGIKVINGEEVDLSEVEVVGEYLGSQMAAFDADASVGIIEHLQDGVLDEPYPTRTVVIQGADPFTATLTGTLPAGMRFDPVSGELSGVPAETGVFPLTVDAWAGAAPAVRRSFTLTIATPDAVLPPRSTVDTDVRPAGAGTAGGDGTFAIGSAVTVTAQASPGFVFASWSENGRLVSREASYTFTNLINHSLVAEFAPEPVTLSLGGLGTGELLVSWPDRDGPLVLQHADSLVGGIWSDVTNPPVLVGTNRTVRLGPPSLPAEFFRLARPGVAPAP